MTSADDLAAQRDDRANRHLTLIGRSARFRHCHSHIINVNVCSGIHTMHQR
jgi:hypothetical protein